MSDGRDYIVYSATITEDGRLKPDAINQTRGRLAKWKNRHVNVTVSRYVKSKTNPQLALFHGPVLQGWSDYTGYDPDETKRELKRAYLIPQLVVARLTGEEITEMPSLRDLNAEEMTTFLERCLREGRQLGIVFAVDAT